MSSVRGLDKLLCLHCNDVTLHRDRRCISCDTPNTSTAAKPVPRTPKLRFNSHQGKHFDAALEQAGARRRARQARSKALSRIRA